jgi:hypothetical protein
VEELAYRLCVGVDHLGAPFEVARVTLHVNGIFTEVDVLIRGVKVSFDFRIVSTLRIEDEAAGELSGFLGRVGVCVVGSAHLPPMTFELPLNILLRLLTTISAYGITCTLTKLPIVSSMTIKKSYLSARARKRGRSAERSNGFEGNSVKSDKIGEVWGSEA